MMVMLYTFLTTMTKLKQELSIKKFFFERLLWYSAIFPPKPVVLVPVFIFHFVLTALK